MASNSNCLKSCFATYVASEVSITDEDYYNQYFSPPVPSPKPSPEKLTDFKSTHKLRSVLFSGRFSFPCFKYYYVYSFIWLVLLSLAGFGLIMYGVFQEDRGEYKKLHIAVGLILILCMLMFVSFLMIDTKRLRKYMLHVLVPWCAGITVIVFAVLIAFLVHFINFKLFLITCLPLSSLAFFTFNEIYHYIGRMRVSPMFVSQIRSTSDEDDMAARRLRTSSRLLQYRPETGRKSTAPITTPVRKVTTKSVQTKESITSQKSPVQPRKQTLPPIISSTPSSQISILRVKNTDEPT